jgi:hypothetical protein
VLSYINVLYWDSIRDEILAFTHANWARWQAEKPDWFTEQLIATIPDEFIPRVDKGRKRSSVFRNLLGLGDEGERNSKGESAKNMSKVAAADEATVRTVQKAQPALTMPRADEKLILRQIDQSSATLRPTIKASPNKASGDDSVALALIPPSRTKILKPPSSSLSFTNPKSPTILLSSTALAACPTIARLPTALVRLPTSSDTYLKIDVFCHFLVTLLKHEFAVVTSTRGSNGEDLRFVVFSQLSAADVALIAQYYYAAAYAAASAAAAVDECILQFNCLQELDINCPEFRLVFYYITLIIFFKRSLIGANFRLYFGAGLSMTDMITDLIMIVNFLKQKNIGFAKAMIIMLSLNMVSQVFLTVLQHSKRGARTLLLELFYTLSLLSPGIHAYRVASGHEKHGKESVDARGVLIFSKCLELIFEAIPGFIIQLFAWLTITESSSFALFSIFMSASTTAFSVSTMYFDKDIDPNSRKLNPSFYGVFPDDIASRSIAYFWLFAFSLAHVLSKGLSLALLWATFGGAKVFMYYGAELGAFYLVKIVRDDIIAWFVHVPR